MTKTDPRAAASLALRDATAVYNAAVAEATQAEDAHAQAEYTLAARNNDWHAALADTTRTYGSERKAAYQALNTAKWKIEFAANNAERTATALRVANAVVATALAERHRLYNIYLDLSAASKG